MQIGDGLAKVGLLGKGDAGEVTACVRNIRMGN